MMVGRSGLGASLSYSHRSGGEGLVHASLPYLMMAAVVLAVVLAVEVFRYRIARKDLRSPFRQGIEGSAGQRLLKRLDALNEEVSIQAAALPVAPIAIYAVYLTHLVVGRRPFNPTEAAAAGLIAVLFAGYTLFRLFGYLGERRRVRLGCEGQMIVGQALNRLMLQGHRVYHDFPADDVTIDHIVVGTKGVFAVATRTPFRRTSADRRQDITVAYDGRALHFPKSTDIEMIAQAKRRSKWLAVWLSRAVGEELSVRAVLALPGWFVKRTAAEGMPVVNHQQFDSLFEHIQARPLTPELIDRITHQLDQAYRNIAPQAE